MSDEKTRNNADDPWIWREFEWKNPETWVPGYGDWCGPGYSAGKYTEEISEEDSQNSLRKITVNGVERPSPVDALCMIHDLDYKRAEGKPNEKSLVTQADWEFVEKGLALIQDAAYHKTQLSQGESSYILAAVPLFMGKIVVDRSRAFVGESREKFDTLRAQVGNLRFPLVPPVSVSFPSTSSPPVKLPPTPAEEAQKARELGAATAGTISDIAKAKDVFVKVVENKAKNIVKAGVKILFKDLNAKANEARRKLANEAALAQGSLVGMSDPSEQKILEYGQSTVNSQFFDENGLLKIYQDELDDLLNTDFSQYLPEVDKLKIFEIDNSRSPSIHVNPNPEVSRVIEGNRVNIAH